MQQARSVNFLNPTVYPPPGVGSGAVSGGSVCGAHQRDASHASSIAGVVPASAMSASFHPVAVQSAPSALQFAASNGHAHHAQHHLASSSLTSATPYGGNQLTAVPLHVVSVLQQQPATTIVTNNLRSPTQATSHQPAAVNGSHAMGTQQQQEGSVPPPAVEASFRVLELARLQVLQRPEHLPHFLVAHSHHHHDPHQPNGLCCGQRVVHHGMLPGATTFDVPLQPAAHAHSYLHTHTHTHTHAHTATTATGPALNPLPTAPVTVCSHAPNGMLSDVPVPATAVGSAENEASDDDDDDGMEDADDAPVVVSPPDSVLAIADTQPTRQAGADGAEGGSTLGLAPLPDRDATATAADAASAVTGDAVVENDASDVEIDVTGGGDDEDEFDDDRFSLCGSDGSSSDGPLSLSPEQLQVVSQVWFTRTPDKEQLQLQGIKWKSGKWSAEENAKLLANIQKYLQENKMVSMREVYEEKRKGFYKAIAMGIDRPLFSVYRRVGRLCVETKSGKFSTAEVTKLKELHGKHKSDWVKIGKLMGRSASSVKDRFRLIKKPCSNGRWTEEEEQLLSRAVHEATGTGAGETVDKAITWSEVATHVPSRSEKQCRVKWINYLSWKEQKGTVWTSKDELQLIEKIENLDVDDEADINWSELAKDWSSVRSPQWLHSRWWGMKRHVPKPLLASHRDTVQRMKETYPAVLERKSASKKSRHTSATGAGDDTEIVQDELYSLSTRSEAGTPDKDGD